MALPTTTLDSLKDDNVEDILLRLPSWASLGHAVCAADRFRRIASSPDFIRRFRSCHASSPRSFLGVFLPRASGLPLFHLAGPARSDPDLVAVARTGDFLLAGLEDNPEWHLDDCRNGRLLLSQGSSRSLTIYDPVSLRRIDIVRPKDDPSRSSYISKVNCLLDVVGGAGAFFRVVSLQKMELHGLRAVEYDSRVEEWRLHPWAASCFIDSVSAYHTMYSAGAIFWNHDWSTGGTSSLMLDTRTMRFSTLPLPANIVERNSCATRYSIGEGEDGRCCLVCVSVGGLAGRVLQVWLLRANPDGRRRWEFHKEKPLSELLAGHRCGPHHIGKVADGLVIVMASENLNQFHHYAIDLKSLSLKAKIFDVGPIMVYPFQLPWPPAGLTTAKRHMV